eukprot:jgi/Sobl393_1/18013/SZX62610.1
MLLQQHRRAVVTSHMDAARTAGSKNDMRHSVVGFRGSVMKRRAQTSALRASSGDAGEGQVPDSQPKQQQPVPQQQAMPQQQQQQQQQRPGAPPPGVPPRPPMALLPPAVAAQAMAAAAASGRTTADLTLQDVTVITSAWLPLLPRTLGECNKLLSQRMRTVLAGDPVAYDLMKQDGKDFMTGAMPAAEFAERFFGIFAAVPQQTADELFLQMALVLPTPEKRLALLRHAQNAQNVSEHGDTARGKGCCGVAYMMLAAPQQQQQQQQQRPGAPPPGVPPRPPMALLPPAVAAQAMAAAAASGRTTADLTLQDVTVITSAWLPLLPRTLGECNKLLSQRMRTVLAGDPVAYDLMKQDGKDF